MKENLTRSGIKLSPVYQPTDSNDDYSKRFGDPGEYPFTRATRKYSGQGWIQRELSGEGDARRSNEQCKYLMKLGQTGLDVIGDSPTMSLMDAGHPLARYPVGTQGVSLCRHDDCANCQTTVRSSRCRFQVLPVDLDPRMSCDVIEFCSKNMPRFHGYLEDTYFFSVKPA